MKKLIFTILASAFSLLAFSQNAEIIVDKINSDGSRFIGTNSINCRAGMTDRHPMEFAVTRYSEGDKSALSIAVEFPSMHSFKIPKGGLLLIKLGDDSTIELHNTTPTEDTQDIIGKYDTYTKMRTHRMHASYGVNPEQMERIINSTVKKIRVETAVETFDIEYKKDKVSSALRAQYLLVVQAAKNKKDLKSDF